jgi:hypothetical protein
MQPMHGIPFDCMAHSWLDFVEVKEIFGALGMHQKKKQGPLVRERMGIHA